MNTLDFISGFIEFVPHPLQRFYYRFIIHKFTIGKRLHYRRRID
jgi:hypothetical protein